MHSDANAGAAATPRLELTGQVDLGQLQVLNDDDAELDGQGPRFWSHDSEDEMRAAMTAACSGAHRPARRRRLAERGRQARCTGGALAPRWRPRPRPIPGQGVAARMSRRIDRVSLTAGLVVIGLGGLLLLDQEDVIDLTLGLVGALVAATIGTILLVSGLAGEDGHER